MLKSIIMRYVTSTFSEADVNRLTSANKALTLRHGGQEQEASVPWVAGCICFGARAGQPHPFTGSEAPLGGQALQNWFRDIVSAKPLAEILL